MRKEEIDIKQAEVAAVLKNLSPTVQAVLRRPPPSAYWARCLVDPVCQLLAELYSTADRDECIELIEELRTLVILGDHPPEDE